jgi:hypothetical protein
VAAKVAASTRANLRRVQLDPQEHINATLGEGRSTDALDSIALTVALEFPMLIDEGAAARMRERRRRYEEDPYSLADSGNDYNPYVTLR